MTRSRLCTRASGERRHIYIYPREGENSKRERERERGVPGGFTTKGDCAEREKERNARDSPVGYYEDNTDKS